MLTIFKYDVQIGDAFTLALPRGAKILSVQTQRDYPRIWALIDPNETRREERQFRVIGTDHPIEDREDELHYIGACQMKEGALIWHLFEVIRF